MKIDRWVSILHISPANLQDLSGRRLLPSKQNLLKTRFISRFHYAISTEMFNRSQNAKNVLGYKPAARQQQL